MKIQKEIKQLIEKEYELKLIAFEFDVPMEQLLECKRQMEKDKIEAENKLRYRAETTQSINSTEGLRHYNILADIRKMRNKYYEIYLDSEYIREGENKNIFLDSNENKLALDTIADGIECIRKGINKKENASKVVKELKKLGNKKLTIEQAENLIAEFKYEDWKQFVKNPNAYYDIVKIAEGRLIDAVKLEAENTNEVETLKNLNRKITLDMSKRNYLVAQTVKNMINQKVTRLQSQTAIKKIRSVPEKIKQVASDIAKGTLDEKEAKNIIAEEASKKYQNNSNKNFATLTLEQEEQKLILQLKSELVEGAKSYQIQDYNKSLECIKSIGNISHTEGIRIVVGNLMENKRYEDAKEMCNENLANVEEKSDIHTNILDIKKSITKREIGELVNELILNPKRNEEETWNLLRNQLKENSIKLTGIVIGKTRSGLKSITLAEIWPEELRNNKIM